ncbi:MAG: sugar phosphate isomerase/epimerase [Eubacteriales bacterium]|nr:sugar phosphate isomerase/epimerase [Eubacteriales bacterium]
MGADIERKTDVKHIRYGAAASEEVLGDNAPVLFQGGLAAAVNKAADMGFDNIEIHIRNPATIDADKLAEEAHRRNIGISAIATGLEYVKNGLCFTSDEQSARQAVINRFMEHITLASKFGAVVFLGTCRGSSPDYKSREEYLRRFAKCIAPLVEYAGEKGVVLALEPIAFHITNLINTTSEALDFLHKYRLEEVKLLLDTHHMFLEDKDMAVSFRMAAGKIAHIHISDSNRKSPGMGNINFSVLGRVLKETDYRGTVSLEVQPYPDALTAAAHGLENMKRFI